jgi:signal transduction histidine kinase
MQPTFRNHLKRLVQWIERWRWLILSFIGVSLLWVEVQEFLVLRVLDQPFHYFEVFQYAVLLISTGTLIELYSRSNRAHKNTLKILEYKHALSMEFTAHEDWELLAARLTELPGRIAEVDESYLLISNPISGKLEVASHWENNRRDFKTEIWDPAIPCQICPGITAEMKNLHLCIAGNQALPYLAYSLAIIDQGLIRAILKFKLARGRFLTIEEQDLFLHIVDEIALALRASQNRRRIAELQSAQIAMAERRMVSAYIHDQLGQNLGYLHLKLDQLGNHKSLGKSDDLRTELGQLQVVANESYEVVRNILKNLQPSTIPHLTNLLREHAKKISRRAGFSLNFRSAGRQVGLLPEAQQLILYIFYEILNNIEKHARADRVSVFMIWRKGCLDMTVTDNGIGFDIHGMRQDNHFGLKILHERLEKLAGCLAINSSTDTGTRVSISMPLYQNKEKIQ